MIYLIRHGQTEYNLARRYQGALDSPLTALGVSQAQAIGRRLAPLLPPRTQIVASPLGRTQATAALLARAGGFTLPITTDPRLAEITLGSWDGLTAAQIDESWPGLRQSGVRHEWLFRSPDGETWDALTQRLGAWLAEAIVGPSPLIVVSHGVSGGVIRGLYAGLPRHETMSLDVPQDAFFRLAEGSIDASKLQEVISLDADATGSSGKHTWSVKANPPVPGLGYSLSLVAYTPWRDTPGGGLELTTTLPEKLEVGKAADVLLTASMPGGMSTKLRLALPAGVQTDSAQLNKLVAANTIYRFETEDGAVTMHVPPLTNGAVFTAAVRVIPTLGGRLQSGASQLEPEGRHLNMKSFAPRTWVVQ